MGNNVFSLRLNSLEREALERLARINGVSQNQLIANLITEAYSKLDEECDIILGNLEGINYDEIDFFQKLAEKYDDIETKLEEIKDQSIIDDLITQKRELAKMVYRQGKYIIDNSDIFEELDDKELEEVSILIDEHMDLVKDDLR